jgi:hypothetical protein
MEEGTSVSSIFADMIVFYHRVLWRVLSVRREFVSLVLALSHSLWEFQGLLSFSLSVRRGLLSIFSESHVISLR